MRTSKALGARMRSRLTTAALASSSVRQRRDLDRLDAAAEGLRERAVDRALESLLEAVK
jgi:hypothetical protein